LYIFLVTITNKYSTVGYATSATAEVGGKAVVDFLTSNGGNISTEYRVQTSRSTDGLGYDASFSVTNVYGYIWIKRI
jgi:hypothetical protein